MRQVGVATAGDLDQIVTGIGAREGLPSIVAGVFDHGDILWERSAGTAGSQYRIGSITKTFTAVAVLQLRDEGRIDLGDPIEAHLSESPHGQRSIRSLLAHSSGLTAEPSGPWWERTAGRSWSALVAANATAPAVFAPGERYHYSNLGFALLGRLVEQIRDVSWWDAISSSILEPLGLQDTTYHPRPDAAPGTSRDPVTGRLMAEPAHDAAAMAPAGQLWSTTADLARWADVLAVGHPQVLAASSLVEMRTVQAGDPDDQHVGAYGLGLRLRWQPSGTLVGHTGSMPGFQAALFVDPHTRIGSVVLANATTGLDDAEAVSVRLVQTVCTSELPRRAARDDAAGPEQPAVPSQAGELAGAWYWGNTAMTVTATPRGLCLASARAERTFEHVGVDRYRGKDGYFAGEDLHVVRRGDRSVSHLEVVTFVLTRRPYDPSAPIPGGPPTPLSSPD